MAYPLPSEYAELARWFPRVGERAEAIGVTREMVRRWELVGGRANVRAATRDAIRCVAAIAREAERRVGDAEAVGEWLLVRQPSLRGERVVDLLQRGDLSGAVALVAPGPSVRGMPRSFRSDETWRARLDGVEMPPRDRLRDPDEAAALRLLGESEERIGPTSTA